MGAGAIIDDFRCTRGFTFMEIIAGLAILGVLLAMITAGRMVHASVPAEAATLKAHLRYAQSLAIANNTVAWSVMVSEHGYTLMRNGGASPVLLPGEPATSRDLPGGLHITSGTGLIDFDTRGAPAQSRVITLSDGTVNRQVRLTGFTGLIP